MAQVNQRLWKIPGQRTKRKAWGFTAQITGKQVRRYKAEWTQDDAEAELAKALLQIEPEKPQASITFSDAVERCLAAKSRKKSVAFDKLYLHQLRAAFGAETSLEQITAARISACGNILPPRCGGEGGTSTIFTIRSGFALGAGEEATEVIGVGPRAMSRQK